MQTMDKKEKEIDYGKILYLEGHLYGFEQKLSPLEESQKSPRKSCIDCLSSMRFSHSKEMWFCTNCPFKCSKDDIETLTMQKLLEFKNEIKKINSEISSLKESSEPTEVLK